MVQQGIDSATVTAFEKFRKAAMAGVHAGTFAEARLHEMEAAKLARELGSKQGKKQAGHARGGPIYVEDAHATMQTRKD
jgi:hypothetical protein